MSERRPVVALLTDFGTSDTYVAQMKGVLLSRCPACLPIDVSHQVPPQNVRVASMMLAEVAERFPRGSVFVVVIDPGVGTQRRILAVSWRRRYFVLPDNGLISLLLDREAADQLYEVSIGELFEEQVSSTFQGRDIMAPAAAFLASGGTLERLGEPVADWERVRIPPVIDEAGVRMGEVLHVDHFGNIITNLRCEDLPQADSWYRGKRKLRIETPREVCEAPWSETYGQHRAGALIALIGSQGWVEISVVNGNAASRLGVRAGEPLRIRVEFLPKTYC